MVLQSLLQVTTLDGVDHIGNPSSLAEDSTMDVPGLEDFLEFLISSDASVNGELVNYFYDNCLFSQDPQIFICVFLL